MSSSTQKERPWVATTMSSPFTTRSCTGEGGRFCCSDCQCAPPSNETQIEVSVPAKSRPLRTVSSRTACTEAPAGSPLSMRVHVLPKSVVL